MLTAILVPLILATAPVQPAPAEPVITAPDGAADAVPVEAARATAPEGAELPVILQAIDAEASHPLPAGDAPTPGIPPSSVILLTSELALTDFRVRLLDEKDHLVPSDDEAEVGQGTRYRLRPREPLVTGSRYRVVVEGQREPRPSALGGAVYDPVSFNFKTLGEKPVPAVKKAPAKKRPRKRSVKSRRAQKKRRR